VRESVVSAKRGWVSFGAKPARSETPARAAAERRPPGRGRSGTKTRSYLNICHYGSWLARVICRSEVSNGEMFLHFGGESKFSNVEKY
jgi:hypothetical protein